jgi:hypothetical protein
MPDETIAGQTCQVQSAHEPYKAAAAQVILSFRANLVQIRSLIYMAHDFISVG